MSGWQGWPFCWPFLAQMGNPRCNLSRTQRCEGYQRKVVATSAIPLSIDRKRETNYYRLARHGKMWRKNTGARRTQRTVWYKLLCRAQGLKTAIGVARPAGRPCRQMPSKSVKQMPRSWSAGSCHWTKLCTSRIQNYMPGLSRCSAGLCLRPRKRYWAVGWKKGVLG